MFFLTLNCINTKNNVLFSNVICICMQTHFVATVSVNYMDVVTKILNIKFLNIEIIFFRERKQ